MVDVLFTVHSRFILAYAGWVLGFSLSPEIFAVRIRAMLIGAHILLYSENPEADRAFFRDVLGFPSVDAGQGWLIFKLPPAEAAFHPADGGQPRVTLYLMCDDLPAQIKRLEAKHVRCSKIDEAPWGAKTTIKLPGGAEIGLYQPKHPTALGLK